MYYDLLTRIKNGLRARKETIHAPFSNFDFAVAKFLQETGYVSAADKRNVGKKALIDIRLKYVNGEPAITDFKLVSKPSRRMYIGYRDVMPVRQGHGYAAISTPSGIMSNRAARKKKVGGEYLFQIW
jgi:small subunit ribosomal protein S8